MENVENSLWQKRKQFKHNWSISLDSGCERTPFTQLECLVASAQCLLGVFYLCGYKHSFTFFQFPSHRKRFNLFYVKDMRLCCSPSLGISLKSNKVPLVHTFFLWAPSVIQFFCFFFVWMVHYQLENADECITMWSKYRYLLIIVSHCNYIIKDIHCFTCLVCQWISEPTRFLHFFWLFVVMKCTTM